MQAILMKKITLSTPKVNDEDSTSNISDDKDPAAEVDTDNKEEEEEVKKIINLITSLRTIKEN